MKKVCMVVPNTMVKGGIASVVNGYHGTQLEKDYKIIYVESYIDGRKIAKLLKALSGYFHFARVLLREKPDLVHIHSSFGPSFYRKIPFIYMASWARIPIINHIHGADFDEFYTNANSHKKEQIKKIYSKCSIIIALSVEWKKRIQKIVPAEKIVIIENYSILYEDAYQGRISRKSNNQILFLGEICQRKGCYDIPIVIKKVSNKIPNIKFILCGSGNKEDEKAIKSLIKESGVESNVEFLGWIRGNEKDQLLRDSDVFFLPSYSEGMPMSVLEAMGYGLPIVSTDVGGIPRIVQNGINGVCCKPGDTNSFAEQLYLLLHYDYLRSYEGLNSIEIIKHCYTLEIHINRLEQTYRECMR